MNCYIFCFTCTNSSSLSFFPVDNTIGFQDPVLKSLMLTIENKMKTLPYVMDKKPLGWFKVLDEMKMMKTRFLSYNNVVQISKKIGNYNIDDMLQHLNDVGIIMWHNDVRSREMIIMNPITSFFKPATSILSAFNANIKGNRNSYQAIKNENKEFLTSDFDRLQRDGIITEELLRYTLMQSMETTRHPTGAEMYPIKDQESDYHTLKDIMLNYNLLVEIRSDLDNHSVYVIPSRLPLRNSNIIGGEIGGEDIPVYENTFYFTFRTDKNVFITRNPYTRGELNRQGYLPQGIFHYVLCRVVAWLNDEERDGDLSDYTLHQVNI